MRTLTQRLRTLRAHAEREFPLPRGGILNGEGAGAALGAHGESQRSASWPAAAAAQEAAAHCVITGIGGLNTDPKVPLFLPHGTTPASSLPDHSPGWYVYRRRLWVRRRGARSPFVAQQISLASSLVSECIDCMQDITLTAKLAGFSINSILYQRGIYPPESFDVSQKYGLRMVRRLFHDCEYNNDNDLSADGDDQLRSSRVS